jgi:dihydroorotase
VKAILIRGARLIDPSQKINEEANLLIADGKIAWIGRNNQNTPANDYSIIEAKNLILCPGFIDLHCHLREPGFEAKETIASGTRAAARGGFTTICCMPNTEPPVDSQAIVNYILEKAASEGVVRVLPIACITKGRKGDTLSEMGELVQAGVVGFSDDGSSVMNSRLMRQALEYVRPFDLPIMEHCEDKLLAEGGQMNEGIIATRLGLQGIPAAAEESIVARDISLASFSGARIHICHISTEGSVELVRLGKKKGVRVTAEVTPHHLTLSEELVIGYDTNAKVNPPLRSEKDIEALIEGLRDGTIDSIATDHAPHAQVEKLVEFASAPFGISGLETAFGSVMSLVNEEKIPIELAISKFSSEPAKIVGLGSGTLKIGVPADIVLIDPHKEWVVDPSSFASKGQNTPLVGKKLKGKVVMTIYKGNVVYKDAEDDK